MALKRSFVPVLALAVALAGAAGGSAPARSQDRPAYEADLLALAGILGAVSYLDSLCGNAESGVWRARMKALVDAQKMSPEDRRRYVDVYNRGQRTFASVHRVCTDETRAVLAHYLEDGAAIAERLEEKYGRGAG
ncbi:TIGR02301 family protein [Chthonobacter rhizosphaerae]|uniref:TIGR02301 family protein n=1 Tax=Chthonobacter rhizosphaerae TaxID=2735553 RepID=UPI0015EEFE0C|nr:TIGR02301 family protein [Chthonobacter rhizosphaerae]